MNLETRVSLHSVPTLLCMNTLFWLCTSTLFWYQNVIHNACRNEDKLRGKTYQQFMKIEIYHALGAKASELLIGKFVQNYWNSCMAKIVITSNSMYQLWARGEGPCVRILEYGFDMWIRPLAVLKVHPLKLPQFVGPCIIARPMIIGAENCTKKMRQLSKLKIDQHSFMN